jgi:hypothetical protein
MVATWERRNGRFYFDATDPSRWIRFALAPTTFHEAIPGHHLQLALAQELDLHPVLGQLEVTAYGEGWGLYAERLADEMGLYATPLQRVGMLTLDSLRASRLVVVTGIHAKGWTRSGLLRPPVGVVVLTLHVAGNAAASWYRDPVGHRPCTDHLRIALGLCPTRRPRRFRRAATARLPILGHRTAHVPIPVERPG